MNNPSPEAWQASAEWLRNHPEEHQLFFAAAKAAATDVLELLLTTRPVVVDSVGRAASLGSHQEIPLLAIALVTRGDKLFDWVLSHGCPSPPQYDNWWSRLVDAWRQGFASPESNERLLRRLDAMRASGMEQYGTHSPAKSALESMAELGCNIAVAHLLASETTSQQRQDAMNAWVKGYASWLWHQQEDSQEAWRRGEAEACDVDPYTQKHWEEIGALLLASGAAWPTQHSRLREMPEGLQERVSREAARLTLEKGMRDIDTHRPRPRV